MVNALASTFFVCSAEVFDHPLFSKWVEEGKAPAIPAMLSLYTALLADKWGVVFMTGRIESQRNITSENLLAVGYEGWTTLLLRYVGVPVAATTALIYTSCTKNRFPIGCRALVRHSKERILTCGYAQF